MTRKLQQLHLLQPRLPPLHHQTSAVINALAKVPMETTQVKFQVGGTVKSTIHLDIESCGSVDDSVNEFVCGSEDIGSCITQFEKETDLEESINNMKVSRDCNGKSW